MQSAIKYSAIIALAMLSACSNVAEEPEAPAPFDPTPGTEPIAFCTSSSDIIVMPQSRSKDPLTQSNLSNLNQLMGIYAFYTGRHTIADCPVNELYLYTKNQLFYHFNQKQNGNYVWKGALRYSSNLNDIIAAPLYWPIDHEGNLSFFAYAPYDDCTDGGQPQIVSYDIDGKELYLKYRPDNVRIERQLDLSFARPVIDRNRKAYEEAVAADHNYKLSLNFTKSLTRVLLYARYSGNLPDNFNVRIADIKIKNILGSRTVAVNADPATEIFEWMDPDFDNIDESKRDIMADYFLESSSSSSPTLENIKLRNVSDTPTDTENFAAANNYTLLQKYNGILMLLPQDITSESSIEVNYSIYKNDSYVTSLHDEIPLTPTTWDPGIYGYYITVHVGQISDVTFESNITVEGAKLKIASYEEYEESGNTAPEFIIP